MSGPFDFFLLTFDFPPYLRTFNYKLWISQPLQLMLY